MLAEARNRTVTVLGQLRDGVSSRTKLELGKLGQKAVAELDKAAGTAEETVTGFVETPSNAFYVAGIAMFIDALASQKSVFRVGRWAGKSLAAALKVRAVELGGNYLIGNEERIDTSQRFSDRALKLAGRLAVAAVTEAVVRTPALKASVSARLSPGEKQLPGPQQD